MLELHAATVLLQWAAGGLLFGWVTTRRREVGIGYGWSIRITYGLMALLALVIGLRFGVQPVRELGSAGVVLGVVVSLAQSWKRRAVGVVHQRELVEARTARVAEMTGIEREARGKDATGPELSLIHI